MSALSNSPHSGAQKFNIKNKGNNKRSYFLRAKTNRLMWYKASEDYDLNKSSSDKESKEEDLANCLVMLSNKSFAFSSNGEEENKAKEMEINVTFQCKSCKKVFGSHQALGGHRASRKRVKGCFGSNSDLENVHQGCSIQEDRECLDDAIRDDYYATHIQHLGRKDAQDARMYHLPSSFLIGTGLRRAQRCHWLTSISSDNSIIQDLQKISTILNMIMTNMVTKHLAISLSISILTLPIPQLGQNDFAVETKREEQRIKSTVAQNEEKSCAKTKLRKLSALGDVKLDKWLQHTSIF